MYGATARYPRSASAGITLCHVIALSGNPCRSRTSGPWPSSRYANVRPLASTDPSSMSRLPSAELVRDQGLGHERPVGPGGLHVDEHDGRSAAGDVSRGRDVLASRRTHEVHREADGGPAQAG